MNPKFFPTVMIVLQVLATISYAINDISDWRRIGYWGAAVVITYCVTY